MSNQKRWYAELAGSILVWIKEVPADPPFAWEVRLIRRPEKIGGETFDWGPHDILVAPSWIAHEHTASSDALVFIYSDRVVQEKLDFWREEKAGV